MADNNQWGDSPSTHVISVVKHWDYSFNIVTDYCKMIRIPVINVAISN